MERCLSGVAEDARELEDLILLDGATNDRVQGEERGSIGISTFELVYAIPNARIVNAAYTHPNELGSRFNDGTRGAWYAADRQKCSISESFTTRVSDWASLLSRINRASGLSKIFQRTTIGWRTFERVFTSSTRRRTFQIS